MLMGEGCELPGGPSVDTNGDIDREVERLWSDVFPERMLLSGLRLPPWPCLSSVSTVKAVERNVGCVCHGGREALGPLEYCA